MDLKIVVNEIVQLWATSRQAMWTPNGTVAMHTGNGQMMMRTIIGPGMGEFPDMEINRWLAAHWDIGWGNDDAWDAVSNWGNAGGGSAGQNAVSTADLLNIANLCSNGYNVSTFFYNNGMLTGGIDGQGNEIPILPDILVTNHVADYAGWGKAMDDRFGQSLGWDFGGYGEEDHWYSWNGPIMRYLVPDKISLSIGGDISAFLGVGAEPVSFTMLTRGKDPGIYLTPTFHVNAGEGVSVGGGFNLSTGY